MEFISRDESIEINGFIFFFLFLWKWGIGRSLRNVFYRESEMEIRRDSSLSLSAVGRRLVDRIDRA